MLLKILSFYHKKRLLINALLSVCQVIVIGGTYFILYSIVLKTLGSVKLGTWSLILSTTSVATIANIGLASSLVKYIASYSQDVDYKQINNLIKTGLISIFFFIVSISLILYIVAYYTLPSVLPLIELHEGLILLPLSLVSLCINSVGGIFLSAIDGLHFSSLRSIIYMVSSILFLIIGYILLPKFGLMGVAIAQITQATTTLFLSLWGLKVIFKNFSIFPFHWDKKTFKEIFGYSTKLQFIGIFQLLYDPVTKYLLTKYGNLSFVGFYELSYRLVTQIRGLIATANQAVVPSIASKTKNITESQDYLYAKVLNAVIVISFPTAVSLIVLSPYISYYWLGYYEFYFIVSLIILSIGYFLNLLSSPAFYSGIGTGDLNGNMISQIVIAILNIILGITLGYLFGGWGVVVAWTISITVGGIITVFIYNKRHSLGSNLMMSKENYKIYLNSFICILSGLFLFYKSFTTVKTKYLLSISIFILLIYIIILLKTNPSLRLFRDKIFTILKKYMMNN